MKSGTRSGPGEFADTISPTAREIAGAIRRMAITLTSRALWQVLGHLLLDGDPETRDAEVFSGIGFYGRPAANGKPEALVIFQGGGAGQPIIIATRDESVRKVMANLAANETAMFNSGGASVIIRASGTVEIKTPSGVLDSLITKTEFNAHTHPTAGTGAPSPPTIPAVGTACLKTH